MKRLFFSSFLLSIPFLGVLMQQSNVYAAAETQDQFVKVYIHKIQNNLSRDCSIAGFEINAEDSARPARPLMVPFVSIATYLKQYTNSKAYTPDAALKIDTPYGLYRLWASESGVMYAKDPQTSKALDDWKAKKIVGVTCDEHGGKKLYIASLVLKAINNKLKVSLEQRA